MTEKHHSNVLHFIMIGALLVILIMLATRQTTVNITSDGQPIDKSIISVAGQSELSVDPDQAYVTLTIETKADTATLAQQNNKVKTNEVLDALKDAGVKDDEIETTGYYLYPISRYDYQTKKNINEGYRQSHTIKVTILDVDDAGKVIDASVRAGINRISNIEFTLSDDLKEEKEGEALELATKEARSKAESIADSLDVKIIKISRVSESNVYYQPYRYYGDAIALEASAEYAPTQISPEDVTISARISIEYVIE